ncbi:cysteine desulfurase [Patescibacteria group bacterium]|nr:cysteine desulfurase [Patescibacteria group bacterium]MBU4600656.1 cysteine desulfurase [Patescibacteria group bacterium]
MKIYLDHSATTPMDKQVLKVMLPYFSDKFGNPSSIHGFGQAALAGVDAAREELSRFLNCAPDEIIFTSGATESDNLAIKGVVKALKKQGIKREEMHIITSLIEHDAVLEPLTDQEAKGMKITRLPVKANGVVDIEKFKKAIRDDTVLVSIMYVNSEVGSIQPIREIGKIIKNINEKRLKEWHKCRTAERGGRPRKIYFHTDATQAVNFFHCDVKRLHCDLLSLSGHKIYGPKGVGALFVKSETPLKPVQLGGHHERNLRSGTLNVPGIVGLGEAIRLLDKKSREVENKKIVKLRDMLVNGIMKNIPNAILNTDREISTPSHAHFSFLGVEGESILISLDLKGIAVSTGSACASSSLKASHVLLAMGIKPEVAHNSIRFTLGKLTTEAEIKQVIKILPPIIKRLRKMSPEH